MYARTFRRATHTRRFSITPSDAAGWQIRDEEDSDVLRSVSYDDWHRVERARKAFAMEALRLQDAGWVEAT